jgi:hypothetical protein
VGATLQIVRSICGIGVAAGSILIFAGVALGWGVAGVQTAIWLHTGEWPTIAVANLGILLEEYTTRVSDGVHALNVIADHAERLAPLFAALNPGFLLCGMGSVLALPCFFVLRVTRNFST